MVVSKTRLNHIVWFIALLICFTGTSLAQVQSYTLNGFVRSGAGLENATVTILTLEEYTVTRENGYFQFDKLPAGQYQLGVAAIGYATEIRSVTVPQTDTISIDLMKRIVGLREVLVTARPKTLGSSSTIERSAIIHTQPMSLADVLQLVPGQMATNPALGSAQQVNLRQIPSTTDAGRANALGTQIIMDGVPLSNNANLQNDVTILNSSPGALPPFSSVAGRGNDLRQIPADNIENIEVIRGIPSAKYGDLTSGLVIVNSRMGAFQPEIRTRINPNAMQAAISMGIAGKSSKNTYNISSDILNAREDVRDPFNEYTRLQGQLAWQRGWDGKKKFITTQIISGYKTIDNLKQDPDDLRYQTRHYSDESSFKFSTDGKWKADKQWLTSLRYTAALTSGRQKSFHQSLVTRDLYPLSTATSDTTMPGVYGKSEYLNQTTVDGKQMNAYANLEATLLKNIGFTRHRIMAGTEWRMDVNKGAGRWFDPLTPPRQNYSMGDRPRTYKEIPALHQLAYYLEDRISGTIAGKNTIVQGGIRFDNLSPTGMFRSKYKTVTSPRINLATEILTGFWLRVGYGVAAKMPTLSYLYPGTRFFDLVNFNYYAANPAERLVIITTRTIPLNDQPLDPYRSKKWETGFDLEKNGFSANVSLFHEITIGAIGMNRIIRPIPYEKLRTISRPPGQPPLLDPVPASIDTFFAAYDVPVNNRQINNQGVEFLMNLPEINAIKTSFNITGVYIRTESFDNGDYIDATNAYQNTQTPERVAIYQSGSKVIADRFNTSLRLIHRIPAIHVVFSGLWQTIWISGNKPGTLSPFPIAYMNRKGEVIPLSEEEAKQPSYADLERPVGTVLATNYPPLHLFNFRCTKEWKKGFGLSFYANNFLNHRPLHSDTNTGGFVRRNEPLFFGAELNISIN